MLRCTLRAFALTLLLATAAGATGINSSFSAISCPDGTCRSQINVDGGLVVDVTNVIVGNDAGNPVPGLMEAVDSANTGAGGPPVLLTTDHGTPNLNVHLLGTGGASVDAPSGGFSIPANAFLVGGIENLPEAGTKLVPFGFGSLNETFPIENMLGVGGMSQSGGTLPFGLSVWGGGYNGSGIMGVAAKDGLGIAQPLLVDSSGNLLVNVTNPSSGVFTVDGGFVAVAGTTALGDPIPNPVTVGGVDPNGNNAPFGVAWQGYAFPNIGMLPGAGIDGLNNAQPLGISVAGQVASVYVLQEGGVDNSGKAQPLQIDATGRLNVNEPAGVSLDGGFTSVNGTNAIGSAIPNPVVMGGADPYGNTYPFEVAEQGVVFPITSMFPIAGMDGSNTANPFGVSIQGNAAPVWTLQVGGQDSSGNARALGVALVGAALPANLTPIAGVDGSGAAEPLPVATVGTPPAAFSVSVGGIDGSGNAQQLGVAANGTSYPANNILIVGGAEQNSATNPLGIARPGAVADVTPLLGVFGLDNKGQAAAMNISADGSPSYAQRSLAVGGTDGDKNQQTLDVTLTGKAASGRPLITGGVDGSGYAAPFGISAVGSAAPSYTLQVGGIDGLGNEQPIGVAAPGSLISGGPFPANMTLVGGVDATGFAHMLGVASFGAQAPTGNTVIVGGTTGDSPGLVAPFAINTPSGKSNLNSLLGGGVDSSSAHQPFTVAVNGTPGFNTSLSVGGLDASGNVLPIGVNTSGSSFNFNSLLGVAVVNGEADAIPLAGATRSSPYPYGQGILAVGGADGSDNMIPFGNSYNGTTAPSYMTSVGGIGGDGNSHPLGVNNNASAKSIQVLAVGGDNGALAYSLPVSLAGGVTNNHVLISGGVDRTGNAVPLGIGSDGAGYVNHILQVGGNDGSTAYGLPVSLTGGGYSSRTLIVGGISNTGIAEPIGINNAGNPFNSAQMVGVAGISPSGAQALHLASGFGLQTAATATTTATAPTGGNLTAATATLVFASTAGICHVRVQNRDASIHMFCGQTNAVSATLGEDVPPGVKYETIVGYGGNVFCYPASGTPAFSTQPTACP